MTNIYDALKFAGCRLSHNGADLYVKVDKVSRRVIREAAEDGRLATLPTLFKPTSGAGFWWEIPHAYQPFWDDRLS